MIRTLLGVGVSFQTLGPAGSNSVHSRNIQGHGGSEEQQTALIVGHGEKGPWIGQRGGSQATSCGSLARKVKTFGFYPMSFHSFIYSINILLGGLPCAKHGAECW